jgi:hypothetical protein
MPEATRINSQGWRGLRSSALSSVAMKRTALVVLAIGGALFVPASLDAVSGAAPLKGSRRPPCQRARVGRHIECVGLGRSCNHRYEKTYEAFGLVCALDKRGHWHLRTRHFRGPPAV